MNGRYEDERRRYGESQPGGRRTFEGEHDVGQSRMAGQGVENVPYERYGARPYATRDENYNYDPRGNRSYSYSGARGSMVSPEWDHYHGDLGGNYQGEFASPYEIPHSGREAPAPSRYPDQGGSRYAGADYGRGFQTPGRGRFDADDAESRQRMQHWSGVRAAQGQAEAYGPYRGAGRLDEGRSGYRSSWGGSYEQMAHGQNFRGRGPQGYERSDQRLTEDICERLTDDPDIDPREVRVQVNSGVVTLEGRVDDRWMKHHIEDLVDASSGVKSIENHIRVGDRSIEPSGSESPNVSGGGSTSQH